MYGTVMPFVDVAIARSAGVMPTVYGLKQAFAGGTAGGFGSGNELEQGEFVVR
jgi:hypothetical protein